jgi:hypothetical protein
MLRLCKPLLTAGFLLIVLAPGDPARAQDGSCGADGAGCNAYGGCGGCGRVGICGRLSAWYHYEPSVTWYAPYPFWWPQYFYGPPHTDYQAVQYIAPPAETALMVKERILAINSANPALLPPPSAPKPFPKEPLPFPKEKQPEKGKEPPLTKLP